MVITLIRLTLGAAGLVMFGLALNEWRYLRELRAERRSSGARPGVDLDPPVER